MLHDVLIRRTPEERRQAIPITITGSASELVVLWHHDMETAIRYPLVDMNEDGVRILTAAPLVEGMTGIAVNLLPTGKAINRPCTVRWARPREEGKGSEAGLRFL